MKNTTKILILSGVLILAIIGSIAGTRAAISDSETSTGNQATAWTSSVWTQTTQTDFNLGSLYHTEIASSPGDVKLASTLVTQPIAILRPTGSGTSTQLDSYPSSTTNYACVDEATADGDTTYVQGSSANSYQTDTYNFPDGSLPSGVTINKITVKVNVRREGWIIWDHATAKTVIRVSGNNYTGSEIQLSDNYVIYATEYLYKPGTTSNWTIADINALQCGVSLESVRGFFSWEYARCTQVWLEVEYSAPQYYTTGKIASQVKDTGVINSRWDALVWERENPPLANTNITFEVRSSNNSFLQDDASPSWTTIVGTSPIQSGLPANRYMQWRATLSTTNVSVTPVLNEVRLYYYPWN